MNRIRFAIIADCHYSKVGNTGNRDCLGAKNQLEKIIDKLLSEDLDFVFSLGDIGNGDTKEEIPEMLEVYSRLNVPVRFTLGNHDLCRRHAPETAKLCGSPGPFYDFESGSYRFAVLNSFEQSRFSPNGTPEKEAYLKYFEEHPDVQLWPGFMTEASWQWFTDILDDALDKRQNVILLAHVPVIFSSPSAGIDGSGRISRILDHERMLETIDRYPNVRAYIAGHYHPGDTALRNGVLYKTVKSVCDNKEPTYGIVTLEEDKLIFEGHGAEIDHTHMFMIK